MPDNKSEVKEEKVKGPMVDIDITGPGAEVDLPEDTVKETVNIDQETKELDGTVTDLDTGLQWELKTTEAGRHYYLDRYTWSDSGKHPNGKAFVEFLGDLNNGVQTEARSTHKCFAKHCDWRIPTISELQSIVSEERPACLNTPDVCTTIPGETARAPWSYLSSTSVFK